MKTESRFCELRLEASPDSPGRLSGILMTYGQKAGDREEVFQPGALHWPADGVTLRMMHDRAQPLARFVPEVAGAEVRISVSLPKTQRAADCVELVKAKVLRGLSVEFFPEKETYSGQLRVIHRARLVGAGLVDSPSYLGSSVAIRSRSAPRRRHYV